ncbi:SIR2 family protein [Agrobacterium deltaense]
MIHLHGRVDTEYLGSDDEGFVLSSGDFGRAYLADGWAARFIQSLLSRFSIVFLGYSADDPPVQYLLEALKGASLAHGRMYAFQSGESAVASSLWENKGVHAMACDPSDGHKALWSTLEAWAQRAIDVDGWHKEVIKKAVRGPEALHPHERGQVAHMLSSADGVRRLTQLADGGIPASWLRVIDPRERYGQPEIDASSSKGRIDPFDQFGLDDDAPPPPPDPREGTLSYLTRPREVPKDSWDGFDLYPRELATNATITAMDNAGIPKTEQAAIIEDRDIIMKYNMRLGVISEVFGPAIDKAVSLYRSGNEAQDEIARLIVTAIGIRQDDDSELTTFTFTTKAEADVFHKAT